MYVGSYSTEFLPNRSQRLKFVIFFKNCVTRSMLSNQLKSVSVTARLLLKNRES